MGGGVATVSETKERKKRSGARFGERRLTCERLFVQRAQVSPARWYSLT
jgi:hypothetical protein